MFKLRALVEGQERVFPLEGSEIRIGRGSDNDLVLPDYSVSRKHAELRREAGGWFIYDLMSTNGLQLNRVTVKKAPIRSGDSLKIGIFEFVVEGEADSRAVEAPVPRPAPPPPAGAHPSASLSSATIIRRLSDFSADYGLEFAPAEEEVLEEETIPDRSGEKRKVLEQAYANKLFGFLTRLARLLMQADAVDEVISKVMEITFEALPVDRGFIILTDEESGQPICELARSKDKVEFRPKSAVPVSETMIETVMRERVALLTYDALADQRLAGGDSIRIHQIRAAMCAPLWSGRRIIGVMQVDSPFHTGTFNEDDLDLLTALANYAAVAVERIRFAAKAEFERQVRSRLERYHSPSVIETVLREDDEGEGVRRLKAAEVTVMFADVVGFTPMAEHSPPEEVADMLEAYFNRAVEAIFAEGGTLDKFIGDCVMAFFGAPVPQEDHALRGVRAAITVQRAIEAWNRERRAAGLSDVRCRLALNSGPVVVGDVGSARRVDYTVLGNTVNVAARLEESVAEPGDIVIGPETCRLLGGSIEVVALGEINLKGLRQGVEAFRVPWAEPS